MIAAVSGDGIPERERAPLAELQSMGMAALVLWWLDDPTADRDAIVDAMVRSWRAILSG